MPTRNEGEDVVVPLQLQPVVERPRGWRAWSGSLVAAVLVGVVVIGLVLGSVVGSGRPAGPANLGIASIAPPTAALHTPYAGPTRGPAPSPLPAIEIIGGKIPTERRLVQANGLQLLDLSTGTLQRSPHPLYDEMLPVTDNELVCACVMPGIAGGDVPVVPSLRFGRFDLDGNPIVQRHLVSLDGLVPVPEMGDGFNVVTALSADHATMYVLVVARRPPVWSIDLYDVDATTGDIAARTSLGQLPVDVGAPSATPPPAPVPGGSTPDGRYAWANFLSAAPNGRSVFASVQYSEIRAGAWSGHSREWIVAIRGGARDMATRLKTAAALRPNDWCIDAPRFVDATLAVQVCAPGGPQRSGASYYVRRLTNTGESLGDLPITGLVPNDEYSAAAIVDLEARAILAWDPLLHTIARVSIDDGGGELTRVPDALLPQSRNPGGFRAQGGPSLVASPDGRRLFALGYASSSTSGTASTGVWVFDARTLALLAHWEPRAVLISLAVSADGRFVYAAGVPGFTSDGQQIPGGASVTVYDAQSGEMQVVYGAVTDGNWLTFPVWP